MEIKIDRAYHSNHCKVIIEFNSQATYLPGPDGKKWLPCDKGCNTLTLVEMDVVSSVCTTCYIKITQITDKGDKKQ